MAGLSQEDQVLLRRFYDEGINRHRTSKETGISEATVTIYFNKWEGAPVHVFDLSDVPRATLTELSIQARMRFMSLNEYIMRLLHIVAEDNLSQAIFDIHDLNPKKKRLKNGP